MSDLKTNGAGLPDWVPDRSPDRPLTSAKPLLREWLLALTMMSLAIATLSGTGSLARLDQAIYDITTRLTAPLPPNNVLIVAIDDSSIDALGAWPWPAARHASAIDALRRSGAVAIGYDAGLDIDDQAVLAPALARAAAAKVPVAMPAAFRIPGANGRAYDVTPPPSAALASHAQVRPDSDGVVRRATLALDGKQRWPHMASALLGKAGLQGLPKFEAPAGPVRLTPRSERLVGFRGPAGSFRSFPMTAVLAGEVPRELIKGRVVLVGLTATGLGAQYSTATSGNGGAMSAVEINASIVSDLMQGRALSLTDGRGALTLALGLLWAVMVAMLLLRPALAGIFALLMIVLTLLLSAAGLLATGNWAQPAAAVLALAVAPPVWAWRRLVVVNDWMSRELDSLGDLGLPKRRQKLASDPVTQTTERLAETIDRVQELRRLADAALRGLPDATLLVSGTGEIVAANGAAEALFGENPGRIAVEAAFKGNELPPFRVDALTIKNGPWHGEFKASDGTVREVRYTPWRDREDRPLGWIMRFADISALRKAEAAREEALQLLTHDMRVPQASILSIVDRSEDITKDTGDRLRALARRTISLADGYLQLARADAGGYAMDEVDLAAIATEAVDEMWALSTERNIRIRSERLDREALSWGNASLLMRAVVNLISNAVKYSPVGREITVRITADVKDWRVDVIDDGPGVSAEVQAQLFGRFKTSGDMGGVGLGLAFVKSVAEGHGGLVRCHSVPEEGAMFSLYLPGLRNKP